VPKRPERTSFNEEERAKIAKVKGATPYWTWLHDLAMEKCKNDGENPIRTEIRQADGTAKQDSRGTENPKATDRNKDDFP